MANEAKYLEAEKALHGLQFIVCVTTGEVRRANLSELKWLLSQTEFSVCGLYEVMGTGTTRPWIEPIGYHVDRETRTYRVYDRCREEDITGALD